MRLKKDRGGVLHGFGCSGSLTRMLGEFNRILGKFNPDAQGIYSGCSGSLNYKFFASITSFCRVSLAFPKSILVLSW